MVIPSQEVGRYRRGQFRRDRLIGSLAQEHSNGISDVEFLVDFEAGRNVLEICGLIEDLRDLLDCDVDVILEHKLVPPFRDRVLDQAIPL
jgi:predicted nucleotidyltransferase